MSVDELLGLDKPRKAATPGGKLGHAFRKVATLPQKQQQRIVATVEDLLIAQEAKAQ